MSQPWATALYHSTAWLKNRNNYLKAVVDTYGHVLRSRADGTYFYEDNGYVVDVLPFNVVPPGMCERCYTLGRMTPATLVHHKIHLTPENVNDPKVALSYDNFQRLCADCHAFVHGGDPEPRIAFVDGKPVPNQSESLEALVMQLTETVDERRNIHRGTHG